MKLVIPTNWDDALVAAAARPEVSAVYGKLGRDFIGGGRPSSMLGALSRRAAARHVKKFAEAGKPFYYLLNAGCLGNREWTRAGNKEINRLLDWLTEIKVTGLTVAVPYLAEYARKKYPHFKLSASVLANVNSVEKAKYWEGLGASVITLNHTEVNRDFRLIGKMRKAVKCGLQLLANDNCLQACPLFSYHHNVIAHASQSSGGYGDYTFDYCRLSCRRLMLADPANFIKATWIRPEDLKVYEEAGIDSFKLVDRTMTTQALGAVIAAYAARAYKGNLYDLFTNASRLDWSKTSGVLHKLRHYFHPLKLNVFKLYAKRGVAKDLEVCLDNQALDGFIDFFLKNDCRSMDCAECGYCADIARKAVKISPAHRAELLGVHEKFLEEIISGDILRY